MTTLPIPSGPTNREIIDRAYQALGISDTTFGLSESEYAAAMLPLGGMMLEWPYDMTGYIHEDAAGLRVQEESGVPRRWLDAVAYGLAERLAPTIGKSLPPEARKVKATQYSRLCAAAQFAHVVDIPDSLPLGAGRRRNW